MKIRTIMCLILVYFGLTSCLFAGSGDEVNSAMPTGGEQNVISPSTQKFHEMVENLIKEKNDYDLESKHQGIKTISYNTDGTLDKVVYQDGDYLQYKHIYGEGGEWKGCEIYNDRLKIAVQKEDKDNYMVTAFAQQDMTTHDTPPGQIDGTIIDDNLGPGNPKDQIPPAKPIVIYSQKSKSDWSRLAKDPIDYDEVKKVEKSIINASNASKEYGKALNDYYSKLEQKISEVAKSKRVKNNLEFKKYIQLLKNCESKADKIKVINKIVSYVSDIPEKSDRTAGDLREILTFKGEIDKVILIEARIALKNTINSSMKEINQVFDGIALLYIKKDKKIDVLINLPKISKNTK